jgi:hypothetical protein
LHQIWSIEILQAMEPIPKKDDNPNYYVLVVNFQRYKNKILSNVHPLW